MKQWMRRMAVAGVLTQIVFFSADAGRGDKAGTSAAPELLIPVGAREIALGCSAVAMTSGIEALYWNPAGLARSPHSADAMFSHMSYIGDVGVDYGAVGVSFAGFGTLALSLKSLSFGDIPVTTEDQPDGTGEIASTTFITLGTTFSRQLADRISAGVTMNYISERMERVSASGVAFNIGVQYNGVGGVEGLSLGVVVKNFGPQMQFQGTGLLRPGQIGDVTRSSSFYNIQAATAELPSVMEIGLGYSAKVSDESKVNVTGLFENNNFSNDEYRMGVEYDFNDVFFIRGGYSGAPQTIPNSEYIFGGTAGIGVHTVLSDVDLTVNYAYRYAQFFNGNHVIAVTAGF